MISHKKVINTFLKTFLPRNKYKELIQVFRQKKIVQLNSLGNSVKKTIWGERNIQLIRTELFANEYLKYLPVWNNIGHFYKPVFFAKDNLFFKKGILLAISEKLYKKTPPEQIDEIINILHKRIPANSKRVLWSDTFDKIFLNKLLMTLLKNKKLFVENMLSKTFLPVTGAHGDLKDEHFLTDKDGAIYIIDWEYFRPHGSIITDILRLYSTRRARQLENRNIKYNPILLLKHGLGCSIDLSEIGQESEIALLSIISNFCIPSEGSTNHRLDIFSENIDLFFKNHLEIQ